MLKLCRMNPAGAARRQSPFRIVMQQVLVAHVCIHPIPSVFAPQAAIPDSGKKTGCGPGYVDIAMLHVCGLRFREPPPRAIDVPRFYRRPGVEKDAFRTLADR